jgi:hypothetical protein
MTTMTKYIKKICKRKVITFVFISASIAAFATLGDGGYSKKASASSKSLLSYKAPANFKGFSLNSGYNYRGNTIISNHTPEKKFVMLNTTVTYQKGNTTYIVPIKRKLFLDKITFNPAQKAL